jgi:hypothetical protein
MPSAKKELTDDMVRALTYLSTRGEVLSGETDRLGIQRSTLAGLERRRAIFRMGRGPGRPQTMIITDTGREMLAAAMARRNAA